MNNQTEKLEVIDVLIESLRTKTHMVSNSKPSGYFKRISKFILKK